MEFRVLGPVRATDGDREVAVGGLKQRTVLAMLIASAPNPVRIETLLIAVYGDDAPDRARRTIQTYVSALRKELGDVVRKDGAGWALDTDAVDVDAARFESAYAANVDLGAAERRTRLLEALELWRGEPYADVEAHGVLDAEMARLSQLRHAALATRIDADLELGRHDAILGELDALVAAQPYQERFRAQHMLALYRAGRQRDALASYQQLRTLLVEELGADPSPELQALEQRILVQDIDPPSDVPSSATRPPASVEPTPARSRIPVPPTPLVGRHAEIAALLELLDQRRIVTVTGPGGAGKSRVAFEAARRVLDRGDAEVQAVELRSVESSDRVAPAIAEALQLGSSGRDPLEQIIEYLADKDHLLVLDGCEHVIDACAAVASALSRTEGRARVLATSRERLSVDGEQIFALPPLDDPVALFEQRAAELDSSFELNETERYQVHALCEGLDGLPLAIELAAARTPVMGVDELLSHLDDRLRLLGGGPRNDGRSLDATLAWSFDLLDGDEQVALARLGVIVGPFDAKTAATVTGLDPLRSVDVLDSLVAKSLVESNRTRHGVRFHLLDSIRAYALARLDESGERESTVDRHLDHWVDRVNDLDPERWLAAVESIDIAIDQAVLRERWGDAARLVAAPNAKWSYLHISPVHVERLEHIRSHLTADTRLEASLTLADLGLSLACLDWDRTRRLAEDAAASDDPATRGSGLWVLGALKVSDDPAAALAAAEGLDHLEFGATTGTADGLRGLERLYAGDAAAALDGLLPLVGRQSVLFDSWAATALLMAGRHEEAAEIAVDHPMTDASTRAISVIACLALLDSGRAEEAKARALSEAAEAALGRIPFESNAILVALAAVAHHDGRAEDARQILTGAARQRFNALTVLARLVAERIGSNGSQMQPTLVEPGDDATPHLRDVLRHWPDR